MFMQFSEVYLPYIPVDFLFIFDADSMMYIVKYNNYMVIIFLRTEKISFNNRKNPEMFHGVRRIIWYPPRGGGVPRPNISTIINTGGLLSFPLLQKPRSVMSYQIPNKKR